MQFTLFNLLWLEPWRLLYNDCLPWIVLRIPLELYATVLPTMSSSPEDESVVHTLSLSMDSNEAEEYDASRVDNLDALLQFACVTWSMLNSYICEKLSSEFGLRTTCTLTLHMQNSHAMAWSSLGRGRAETSMRWDAASSVCSRGRCVCVCVCVCVWSYQSFLPISGFLWEVNGTYPVTSSPTITIKICSLCS